MIIILAILLAAAIGTAGYFYLKRFKLNVDQEAREQVETSTVEEKVNYDSLKIKESPQEETPAQVEKRLKKIINPDQEKPFAKISKPDISEISEVPQDEVKPKKKRNYKRRYRKPQNPQS